MLTVFHNRRWDSDFLTVRKVLPRLGEIMLFEAHWDRFRPEIKHGWREVPQPGGGRAQRPRPAHDRPGAAAVRHARRRFRRHARAAAGRGGRRLFRPDAALRRAAGVPALLDPDQREPRPRFAVHGSGGSFVKYGLDPQEAQLKAGMDPRDARLRRRCSATAR